MACSRAWLTRAVKKLADYGQDDHPDEVLTRLLRLEVSAERLSRRQVRAMVRNAKQVVVVADSSKAGQCSPALICPASAIDLLITDDGISDEVLAGFSRQKIQVLVV